MKIIDADYGVCRSSIFFVQEITLAGYYWKADGHHNSIGYNLMIQCVYDNLASLLKDSR